MATKKFLTDIEIDGSIEADDGTFTGNVGIGTTSPSQKLTVEGNIELGTGGYIYGDTTTSYLRLNTAVGSLLGYSNAYIGLGPSFVYNVGGSEKFRISSASGYVGIGTTSPGHKLDVRDGTITSRDSGNVNYAELDRFAGLTLKGNGAGAKYVSTPNTDALGFKTNNSERMRITSTGNVGIGTTSPSGILSVSDGTYDTLRVNNGTSHLAGTRLYRLDSEVGSSTAWMLDATGNSIIVGPRTGTVQFSVVDASENVKFIVDNGNVGIGTTSPANKLEVVSPTTDTATFKNSVGQQVVTFGSTTNTTYSDILLKTNSGTGEIFKAGTGYTSWGGASSLNVYNSNGAIAFHPNSVANAMFIATSGNVGIGTTSPSAKLHIQHNGGAGSGLYVKSNVNRSKITVADNDSAAYVIAEGGKASYGTADSLSANNLTIDTSGNVGIGTTTPNAKLHVNTSDTTKFIGTNADYVANSVGSGVLITTGASTGNTYSKIYAFKSGNTAYANLVVPGGNVGIGTTGPGVKLDVAGEIRTSSNFIADNATLGSLSLRISGTETGRLDNFNSALRLINFHATSETAISGNGDISLTSVGSNNIKLSTANTERMRIASNGVLTVGGQTSTRLVTTITENDKVDLKVIDGTDSGRAFTFSTSNSERMRITSAGDMGIGVTTPRAKLDVAGGIKVADDTDTAGANKVGTLRYRTSGNNSYVDMCMQTGASTYAWINVVQNNW